MFWVFREKACVGGVKVISVEAAKSTCLVCTDSDDIWSNETYAAVRSRYIATNSRHSQAQAPDAMPFGEHPLGPWDSGSQSEQRSTHAGEIVTFVGVVHDYVDDKSFTVRRLWGDSRNAPVQVLRADLATSPSAALRRSELGMKAFEVDPRTLDNPDLQSSFPLGALVVAHIRMPLVLNALHLPLSDKPGAYLWEAPVVVPQDSSGLEFTVEEPGLRVGFKLDVSLAGLQYGVATVESVTGTRALCRLTESHVPKAKMRGDETIGTILWEPGRKAYVALHGAFTDEERRATLEVLEFYDCMVLPEDEMLIDIFVTRTPDDAVIDPESKRVRPFTVVSINQVLQYR